MTYSSVKSSCVLAVVLWLLCNVSSAEFYSDSLKHHKMEKQIPRDSFVQKGKSSSSEVHKLVFAVHQKNLDVLEQKLKEASTPGSPKYLQWMTFEEVGKLSSDPEAAHEITEWLEKNGATIVSVTKHLDFITANAPIETWEKLLDTEFFEWEDQTRKRKSGTVIHRAKEYSVPLELKEHVTAVFNTVQTPPPYKAKYHFASEQPYKRNLRMSTQDSSSATVSYLNSLYRIQNNSGSAQLSQSVFETSDMYFSPNDLTAFQNEYDLPVQAAEVKHGFDTDDCVNNECVEGNLDIQYIMGVAQETVSIYWYADNSNSDPFVVWITEMANMSNPPQSNSVSWGAVESYMSSATMNAFNTQAMKLSLQGVTIAVSSGDDGAASGYQTCLCAGVTENGETSTGYNPSFPATSPYVTAVGGTMGGSSETVCQADKGGVITSGGGFSGQFSALDWQTDAVNAYFDGLSSQPVSGYYRNGRAYPDISLLAVNYPVVIQNRIVSVYGTSASAPVFAAMVSLVNAARLKKGLGSIGFINPTLYAIGMNASSVYKFNDVTSGNNKCCAQEGSDVTCCSTGFVASSGWDPATGWGSVNYDSFSGMYEAYTPYTKKEKSGTDITLEMWIIIIVVGVLLICAIGSCFSWCFCRSRDTPPTQQRVVYHDPRPQHRLSPVHIQSANRM